MKCDKCNQEIITSDGKCLCGNELTANGLRDEIAKQLENWCSFEAVTVSCPEGKSGCCVIHYGIYCRKCGAIKSSPNHRTREQIADQVLEVVWAKIDKIHEPYRYTEGDIVILDNFIMELKHLFGKDGN